MKYLIIALLVYTFLYLTGNILYADEYTTEFQLNVQHFNPQNIPIEIYFLQEDLGKAQLEIYDILGKMLISFNINLSVDQCTFNLDTNQLCDQNLKSCQNLRSDQDFKSGQYLRSGIYLYKLRTHSNHYLKKVTLII